MRFDEIWQRIVACAGQEFYMVRGESFAYKIVNEAILPSRTRYRIARSEFEKAAALPNITGPGQISQMVRGPSYVFAILTDPRIRSAI